MHVHACIHTYIHSYIQSWISRHGIKGLSCPARWAQVSCHTWAVIKCLRDLSVCLRFVFVFVCVCVCVCVKRGRKSLHRQIHMHGYDTHACETLAYNIVMACMDCTVIIVTAFAHFPHPYADFCIRMQRTHTHVNTCTRTFYNASHSLTHTRLYTLEHTQKKKWLSNDISQQRRSHLFNGGRCLFASDPTRWTLPCQFPQPPPNPPPPPYMYIYIYMWIYR
jgi:hypothetical protein